MFLSALSYILWGIVVGLAVYVCVRSERPGQRRKRRKEFEGPDRRSDPTVVDFLEQPIFCRPKCRVCGTIGESETFCEDCPFGKTNGSDVRPG
jgi:hypothetical protein